MDRLSVISGVGAVFATIAFMSVFMPWFTGTTYFLVDAGISGWQIFHNGWFDSGFDLYALPAVIGALGLFAMLVFVAAPKGNVTRLLLAVLGIMIIVLTVFTYMEFKDFMDPVEISMVFGIYMTMIAGAVVTVTGAIARR